MAEFSQPGSASEVADGMKILFLTQRFPYPPVNGGMLRTHQLLSGITEKHQVELACFAETPPNQVPYANTTVHSVAPRSFNKISRAAALVRTTPVYPLANYTRSMSN